MVTFILNKELVTTGKSEGSSLLDFLRYDMGLTGTKTGCREGDCGACTVLCSTLTGSAVVYKSAVSCLMPLGNAHGKHIVTIEGINSGHLSHIQQAMVDNGAIQCGFCTPGIVMSLVAESTSPRKTTGESAISSIAGNICRCTGYKSIERAAQEVAAALADKDITDPVRWLVERQQLPDYFLEIPVRLSTIAKAPENIDGARIITVKSPGDGIKIAGGTDLMVRHADELAESAIISLSDRKDLKGIKNETGKCILGASVTISEAGESETLREYFPGISTCIPLIASEPVRNMATIAGNIVNASPIGDMTIIMLALDAEVTVAGGRTTRVLLLKDLFLGYKKLDLAPEEYLRSISFEYDAATALFNFEKVSRRTHLDIASVNSAIQLRMEGDLIAGCHLSAGGVSPVPLYLSKTNSFLKGRPVSVEILQQANTVMQEEISPISDARGSAEYKRLLLRQLLFAHFMKLFPEKINPDIGQL
jgi:xanthine dehydrogenase small subunit